MSDPKLRNMTSREVQSYWVRIYLSGPIDVAKQVIRKFCFEQGLCVNITPCDYIYTGGEEAGYIVELVNYPKYPQEHNLIQATANSLATMLMQETFQDSFMLMDYNTAYWRSYRKPQDG